MVSCNGFLDFENSDGSIEVVSVEGGSGSGYSYLWSTIDGDLGVNGQETSEDIMPAG